MEARSAGASHSRSIETLWSGCSATAVRRVSLSGTGAASSPSGAGRLAGAPPSTMVTSLAAPGAAAMRVAVAGSGSGRVRIGRITVRPRTSATNASAAIWIKVMALRSSDRMNPLVSTSAPSVASGWNAMLSTVTMSPRASSNPIAATTRSRRAVSSAAGRGSQTGSPVVPVVVIPSTSTATLIRRIAPAWRTV